MTHEYIAISDGLTVNTPPDWEFVELKVGEGLDPSTPHLWVFKKLIKEDATDGNGKPDLLSQ